MSKKRLLHAQVEVLRWLQGRVEDQMVRAYITTEIATLRGVGYPINSSGTELTFPKREKKPPQPLPGQMQLESTLEEGRE